MGEATVAKALTLLSSMFRCAVTWDIVDRNPLREIRIPQAKRKRLLRPAAPERAEQMRVSLRGAGRASDAVLLAVLAYAGLRPQEARARQWGDVGEPTLRVERAAAGAVVKATKTGELRTARLLEPLAADLRELRVRVEATDDALVFPAPRGRLMSDEDWRNWRGRVFAPVASAHGLEGSRPSDLRHSFASLLIREGASVVSVARQMGKCAEHDAEHVLAPVR